MLALASSGLQTLKLAADIELEAAATVDNELRLSRGYARLACLLALFKKTQGWRELNIPSFNHYLVGIAEKYGREPKTLYQHIAIAEKLLPLVGENGLDQMGVTKALVIVRAANKAKSDVRPELLKAGLDATTGVSQLRALAHQVYELEPGANVTGKWLDLGGMYVEDEQFKLFHETVEMTERLLNLAPTMPSWQRRLCCLVAWMSEFSGTHSAEVYGNADSTNS